MLREDNADLRLTETGRRLGVVDDSRWQKFSDKREQIEQQREHLASTWIGPQQVKHDIEIDNENLAISKEVTLLDLLKRPGVTYEDLLQLSSKELPPVDQDVMQQLEIEAKYSGYIGRQQQEIDRQRRNEQTSLPDDMNYEDVRGLSTEVRQKLIDHRPQTLGQAARISGVTPAAISLLMVHLKSRKAS